MTDDDMPKENTYEVVAAPGALDPLPLTDQEKADLLATLQAEFETGELFDKICAVRFIDNPATARCGVCSGLLRPEDGPTDDNYVCMAPTYACGLYVYVDARTENARIIAQRYEALHDDDEQQS